MTGRLLILVAGPYRSGTNDDPVLIQKNVDAMEDTALKVFRRGHLPVLGEWFALPLLKHAGSKAIGDSVFDEIFHPIARELIGKCDAVLRIGGPSTGADDMVATGQRLGKRIFRNLSDRFGETQVLGPLTRALVAVGRIADANRVVEECRALAIAGRSNLATVMPSSSRPSSETISPVGPAMKDEP